MCKRERERDAADTCFWVRTVPRTLHVRMFLARSHRSVYDVSIVLARNDYGSSPFRHLPLILHAHGVSLSRALVSIPLKSSNWKVLLGPRSFNGEMYISIDQTTYPILASSSRLLEAPTFTVLAVQYLLATK